MEQLFDGKVAIVTGAGSGIGQVALSHSAAYVTAKHGIVGLSRNAAVEYAAQGIRVNAVGPAFINTPLLSVLDDQTKQALIKMHPIGRFGESKEVAELVIWL